MTVTDIAPIRLISQHIAGTTLTTVKSIVGWMGAMQAQDYAMVQWALGVRLFNSTHRIIEAAINSGEILRTHILRPTWHFVSADDIYWLLDLTAPRIKASLQSRHKDLGLSGSLFTQSYKILETALNGGRHARREELVIEFGKANIAVDSNRAYHLLFQAELDGILCSGAPQKGKPTYALLEERVPKKRLLTQDEALAMLAQKYFTSHGPATIQDFAWWSGLPSGKAKYAMESVKSDFVSETIGSHIYWFSPASSIPSIRDTCAYLLPAFDEFIISYKDRGASLPGEHHHKAVSNNGIFRPIIVVNGHIVGIWKRTIKKHTIIVETEFFTQLDSATQSLIDQAARQFGNFLEKETEIHAKF